MYNAFISYSHAKDKPIAAALQSVVQKLGKPWYRRRALRVFRDDASLSATPHLWPTIEQALAQSRFLIVLASPEAAASLWVTKEVVYWLEHKNAAETLLIAVTDGELVWDNAAGDFDWTVTPLPPVLAGRLPDEPKWVDLRAYRDGTNPRDAKFIELAADFAAAVRGIPKDDLLSQEVRQQRRALALAWSAAAALMLVTGVAAWQWNAAVKSERVAVGEKARAELNFSAAKETVDSVIFDLAQGLRDVEGMRVETVRRILGRAEAAVTKLMSRTGNDPNVRTSQAAMFSLFGDAYLRLGDTQLAADYAQKSLDVGRELVVSNPDNTVMQNNLAQSLTKFEEILVARGDLHGALAADRESLDIRRKLLAKEPDNTRARWAVTVSLDSIGRVLMKQNDLSGALTRFRESIDIQRDLLAKEPGSPIWRNGIATSLVNTGSVLMLQGDLADAVAAYSESVDRSRELLKTDPNSSLFQRNMSVGLNKLGYALAGQGNLPGALAAYRESMDTVRKLIAKDPENSEYQNTLAFTLAELGNALMPKGDLNGALAAYQESLTIQRALSAKDHNNLQQRVSVAGALQKIGDVLSSQSDLDGALAAHREGLKELRELTAEDASRLIWRRDLSVCLNKIGSILLKKADPNGALALHRESLDIARTISANDPSNAVWQTDVAITLNNIGEVLEAQGDLSAAGAAYREALDILRAVLAKDQNNTKWTRVQAVILNRVGNTLRTQGDLSGAVAAHRESLDIARNLARKDSSNAQWQMDVVYSLDYLAKAGDDPPDHWKEAAAILAKLKSQGALAPAQQGWIGKINSALAALSDAKLAVSTGDEKLVALEQIDGAYDGTNTFSQRGTVANAQLSLTFHKSGINISATYKSALGGEGSGSGTINGDTIYMMSLKSETPSCPGSYIASFKFDGDSVSWNYTGQDCNGPVQGRGSATKTKS